MNAVARRMVAEPIPAPEPAWCSTRPREIAFKEVATVSLDGSFDEAAYRRGVIIRWLANGRGWLLLDRPEPGGKTFVDFGCADVRALDDVPLSMRELACLCLAYCEVLS